MANLRFDRRVLSSTTTYIVFPKGDHYAKIEDAFTHAPAGSTIREYTTIVKNITVINEKKEVFHNTGTYIQSKTVEAVADATPAPLPEEDLPFWEAKCAL